MSSLAAVSSLPLLVLAALVGLAYAATAVRSLAAALSVFAILTFFDVSPIDQLTRLAGVVLLLLWVGTVLSPGSRAPLIFRDRPQLSATVLMLAGWFMASTLWARDKSLAMTDMVRLVQGIVLVPMIYTAVQRPVHIRWILLGFVCGALISGVLGLTSPKGGRITGGFDDPNELAAVLVPGAVLCAFGFMALRGSWLRWILLACVPVLGLSLLHTDSQGGLVALTVSAMAAVVLGGSIRPQITAVVLVAAVAVGIFYTAKPPTAGQFTEGGASREDLWRVALHVSADHPLLGVGAGNFPVVEPGYALEDIKLVRADLVAKPEVAHNTYLHVLAEYGSIGLGLLLSVMAGSLLTGLRAARIFARRRERQMELLARGQVVATVSMLAAYFFQSGQFEKQLWLMLGFSAALHAVAVRGERLGEASAAPAPPAVRTLVPTVGAA